MGNNQSNSQKINFEDMQFAIKNAESHLIINTLNENEQKCLILNTLPAHEEENVINKLLNNGNRRVNIIIYGKNSNDNKIYEKHSQLTSLGFYNVYIYVGGMFEWLMLQDIYGDVEFPTTSKQLDILKYKPNKIIGVALLEY
jgi:rhodanese-related sulfurtransferase